MVSNLGDQGYDFVELLDEVSSTMDYAREAIPRLQNGAGVVCAKRQVSGRGRQGRTWSSTDGALMATFLFQSKKPVSALTGYSLAVGLAMAEALRNIGAPLMLKWPNDLVVVRHNELHKIGGILIEVEDLGDQRVLLVGIGVNVSEAPQEVPHSLALSEVANSRIDRESVLVSLAVALRAAHDEFTVNGFAACRDRWLSWSCFEPGKTEVTIDVGTEQVCGIFIGIDERGSLALLVDGRPRLLASGHVVRIASPRRA